MAKKDDKRDAQIAELTADLQRMRADFENYRKRVEGEKSQARDQGAASTALKLLPVIDTIERAILHIPPDIAEHPWVQGVAGLIKQLDKALADMDIARIDATPGVKFNPEQHQAIQMDEEAKGDHEVVAEELQAGYLLRGQPIRHAMVKVTRA
ncbi:MAG: nucleotide exchange factor GrpE [Candidatus Saccharibacteria bacterium]|nr:nucleotide exchange factor GrpE [Candidatus Saccharibacteria bacterium]MCA9340265.1 nucleotide exchange factor GrpE [Candidatus Saccharibacteria bacterium]